MSEHGAALQTYNQELVKCLEDLRIRKNEILDVICREEAEIVVLEKNMKLLQEKLYVLNKALEQHKEIYESYERTVAETENGFKKILDSSQMLLQVVQQEVTKFESTLNSPLNTPPNVHYRYNNTDEY